MTEKYNDAVEAFDELTEAIRTWLEGQKELNNAIELVIVRAQSFISSAHEMYGTHDEELEA